MGSETLSLLNTYFSGKDPVSYPLVLLLTLLDGLTAPPVLQRNTDLQENQTSACYTKHMHDIH